MKTLKFKKTTENAIVPVRANSTDAGLDLTATSVNETDMYIEYGTGLACAIPEGYVGLLFPRSSVTNKDLMLKNSVGVIDSGFRGEIKARFAYSNKNNNNFSSYNVGERCCQLLIIPINTPTPILVDNLDETTRGDGSFGSSGA